MFKENEGKGAIGSFNLHCFEMVPAMIKAAEKLNVPVILQTSLGTAEYIGFEPLIAAVKACLLYTSLNQIGALYYQAEELESAIKYYEESLSIKKEMGKSYTDLMSLYNKKRQQAAENKNDEQMNYYMQKVQEMMQMSKDMLRGKM